MRMANAYVKLGQLNDSELMTRAVKDAKPTTARSAIFVIRCSEARRKLYGIVIMLAGKKGIVHVTVA